MMEGNLEIALENEEFSDYYFAALMELMSPKRIEEQTQHKENYLRILAVLFENVNNELAGLSERIKFEGLGLSMNLASGLHKVLDLISNMLTVDFVKEEFKKGGKYVYVTIKSFLKIRKLFLIKNSVLR